MKTFVLAALAAVLGAGIAIAQPGAPTSRDNMPYDGIPACKAPCERPVAPGPYKWEGNPHDGVPAIPGAGRVTVPATEPESGD